MSVTELCTIEQLIVEKIQSYNTLVDDDTLLEATRISARDTISTLEEILEVVQRKIARHI